MQELEQVRMKKEEERLQELTKQEKKHHKE